MTDISANLSVPTIDEKAWRASEPHTPNPRARLEAVGELNRAGIPTGVLVAPLMPGINDDPAQVEEILQAAADAGATGVSGIGLHLRGEVRGIFMEWLRVLPAGPRGALRGALCTRRVPAASRAGADQRTRPAGADGDAGAAVRRLPARAGSGVRGRCRTPDSGRRATAAGAGAGADDALLSGGVARGRSVTTVTAWSRYRPGRVVLSLYVSVHHDPPTTDA